MRREAQHPEGKEVKSKTNKKSVAGGSKVLEMTRNLRILLRINRATRNPLRQDIEDENPGTALDRLRVLAHIALVRLAAT